jgi:hypothetical protein
VEMSIVPITETSRASKETASRVGIADKPVSDACFNDWKRFCFVLREIASGEDGRPLPSHEAQKRAQAVLVECGYTWPGRAAVHEPVVVPTAAPENRNAQAPAENEQSTAGTKLKSEGKAQSRSGRYMAGARRGARASCRAYRRSGEPPTQRSAPERTSHRCY